jgi:hypothetical protein
MAHQSPIVPIRKQRTEPISWPTEDSVFLAPSAERAPSDLQQTLVRSTASAVKSFRRLAIERPLHVIGIVAAVSLIAGVALRIWRSKHYA